MDTLGQVDLVEFTRVGGRHWDSRKMIAFRPGLAQLHPKRRTHPVEVHIEGDPRVSMDVDRSSSNDLSTCSRALPGKSQTTSLRFVHILVLRAVRCGAARRHLGTFVVSLLAEGREQHDPSVVGEPVCDPPCCGSEREPQLEQALALTLDSGIRADEPSAASRSMTTTVRSQASGAPRPRPGGCHDGTRRPGWRELARSVLRDGRVCHRGLMFR